MCGVGGRRCHGGWLSASRQGFVAGDETGLVASVTNMTSTLKSPVPLLETTMAQKRRPIDRRPEIGAAPAAARPVDRHGFATMVGGARAP
jgi:hypothetical protein